jgi:hypothetical protein
MFLVADEAPRARTALTLEYSTIDKQYELKWRARGAGVIREQAVTKSQELSR